jgi:mycofactocin precursor
MSGAETNERRINMEAEQAAVTCSEEPRILEEIQVEELAIDGICGVY